MKILPISLLVATILSAQVTAENGDEKNMKSSPDVPPEVLAFIAGASTPESLEFEFLIGSWDIEGIRLLPDGNKMSYVGKWEAHYINEKRMVIDDFKILSPKGTTISSYVTLRSYSPISKRWELSGLAAMSPSLETHEWYGTMVDNEMILNAVGKSPDGRLVANKIKFYEITENQFKWKSNLSFDNGKTWIEVSSLTAKRLTNKI